MGCNLTADPYGSPVTTLSSGIAGVLRPPTIVPESTSPAWLTRLLGPWRRLADPQTTRKVIQQLTKTLDDKPVAGDTYWRRRRGLNAAIEYAVESSHLDDNPLKKAKTKRVAIEDRVDPFGRRDPRAGPRCRR